MKGLVKGNPKGIQSNFVGSITNYAIDTGVKGRYIPFNFSPTALSDSVQANFTQTAIPGSSAPQITYSSTGARQVSFSIDIPLDYLPPNSVYEDIEDYLNAFRALTYPKYSSAGSKVESPHCKLVTSNLEIDGVCTSCSIEYKTDRYASDGSMAASVSLSFLEVLDNVKDVDAKWIANSKIKILGSTNMTTQTSNGDDFLNSYGSTSSLDKECNITLLGSANVSLTDKNCGLKDMINNGRWTDPGYIVTNSSTYTVKCFYGYSAKFPSVSNITINGYGTNTCICNGAKTTLSSGPVNSTYLLATGQSAYYFIIYVPLYDGNKYVVDKCRIRTVSVRMVS